MDVRRWAWLLALAAAAALVFVYTRQHAPKTAYEVQPNLTPGPLIAMHTYSKRYPMQVRMSRPQDFPGSVYRKMLVPNSTSFAIKDERTGQFLQVGNGPSPDSLKPKIKPVVWGAYQPSTSVWTAEPGRPETCLMKGGYHIKAASGDMLTLLEDGGTKKGCSKTGPDCNDTAFTPAVWPGERPSWKNCWKM